MRAVEPHPWLPLMRRLRDRRNVASPFAIIRCFLLWSSLLFDFQRLLLLEQTPSRTNVIFSVHRMHLLATYPPTQLVVYYWRKYAAFLLSNIARLLHFFLEKKRRRKKKYERKREKKKLEKITKQNLSSKTRHHQPPKTVTSPTNASTPLLLSTIFPLPPPRPARPRQPFAPRRPQPAEYLGEVEALAKSKKPIHRSFYTTLSK